MTKATENHINELHRLVAQVLLEGLRNEPEPWIISNSIKFLKDNAVTADIGSNEDMTALSESLKAKREKRKLRIIE